MKASYIGQTKEDKNRFAQIEYNPKNEKDAFIGEFVIDSLLELGYIAHGFGDPDEVVYFVEIIDREAYEGFMVDYKDAKKEALVKWKANKK